MAERTRGNTAREASASGRVAAILRSSFGYGILGAVLLWAAFPPLEWWPLAWIAPVPWIVLARRETLPGRRPYLGLWLAGFGLWLAALHWLTLPHWATAFGWLALSAYLAVYLPLFVGLTRVGVHQLRLSPIIAAPVVWTGLELGRAYFLGGFSMVMLAHTQYRWISLIQMSDLFGAYGVSFVIILVAACLARMLPVKAPRVALWPLAPLTASLAAAVAYGQWRMSGEYTQPGPKVALIQGSIDIELQPSPDRQQRIFEQYVGLSQRAAREHDDLDLMVWPETMFPGPWFTFDDAYQPPAESPWTVERAKAACLEGVQNIVRLLDTHCLLGIDTTHFTPTGNKRFNSALFVDRQGNVLDRYDKVHLVTFGEYVPLASRFPWLYRLTPLPSSLDAGGEPVATEVGGYRYAPNICYESTVPHLIRGQVNQLRAQGAEPDVLVNLTNDGWFWGSAELDMHLVCSVFRAVENRKPVLIAANTGFSAWIDGDGRIVKQGPRRATEVIVANAQLDARGSVYRDYGDWLAVTCLTACLGLTVVGIRGRRRATAVKA